MFAMVDFPSFGFVFFKHFRHAAREIRATFIVDPVVDRLTHRPIESLNAATLAVLQPIAGFHVIASILISSAAKFVRLVVPASYDLAVKLAHIDRESDARLQEPPRI